MGYRSCLGSHSVAGGSGVWTRTCPALFFLLHTFPQSPVLWRQELGRASGFLSSRSVFWDGLPGFCVLPYTCSLPTCGHTGTANTTGREDVPGELGLAGGEPLLLAGCPQSLCPAVGSGLGSRVWAWHLLLHLQSDMTLHHLPGHLLFSTSHLTSCPTVLTWKSDWCPRLYSSQALLWTFHTSPSIPSFPTSVNSCFYLFLSDPRPVS